MCRNYEPHKHVNKWKYRYELAFDREMYYSCAINTLLIDLKIQLNSNPSPKVIFFCPLNNSILKFTQTNKSGGKAEWDREEFLKIWINESNEISFDH